MKIAFVTDDGKTISAHFGRAAYYLVVDVDGKKEVGREMRDKMGHTHFHAEEHHEDQSGEGHGFGQQAQFKHASMLGAIVDCAVVVCGGMGLGAVQSIKSSGKDLRLTDVRDIDEALKLYLADNLPNLESLSH